MTRPLIDPPPEREFIEFLKDELNRLCAENENYRFALHLMAAENARLREQTQRQAALLERMRGE